MTATALRYIGLPTGLSDGGVPRLQVATLSGRIREIPLTRQQLIAIARSAISGIELLDREAAKSAPTARDLDEVADEIVDVVLAHQGQGVGGPHAAVRALLAKIRR